MSFPHSSVSKESACRAGDEGSIPGSGTSPREGNGNPLQYSYLENPMDRTAWQATVRRKSWTWLSNFHLHRPPQAELSFDQSLTFCRRAEFPCCEPEAPLEASQELKVIMCFDSDFPQELWTKHWTDSLNMSSIGTTQTNTDRCSS